MTSYRQMRRHARRARRAGTQPMMVINSGDPLPELVIVIIARWACRHRPAFAPFAVARPRSPSPLAHEHMPEWLPVAR